MTQITHSEVLKPDHDIALKFDCFRRKTPQNDARFETAFRPFIDIYVGRYS